MYIDSVLQSSIVMWDECFMEEEKKEDMIPDEIPIFWVNII